MHAFFCSVAHFFLECKPWAIVALQTCSNLMLEEGASRSHYPEGLLASGNMPSKRHHCMLTPFNIMSQYQITMSSRIISTNDPLRPWPAKCPSTHSDLLE